MFLTHENLSGYTYFKNVMYDFVGYMILGYFINEIERRTLTFAKRMSMYSDIHVFLIARNLKTYIFWFSARRHIHEYHCTH